PLATLKFLDIEDVANAFHPVPRDILQLILRLILLTLFVLLMSRLIFSSGTVGPRAMAVILDHSMSMQQKAGEGDSLFGQHKRQILELIDGMNEDDRMSLILVGDHVTTETAYLQDKKALREIAEGFEVSDSGALALIPTIQAAVNQLRSRKEINSCAIVFSDHQHLNYANALAEIGSNEAITTSFRSHLGESRVKLLLIDESVSTNDNLTIESASFNPERVTIGSSSRLSAVIRNNAEEEKTSSVRFLEGDTAGVQRSITLQPGEAAHMDLVHRFESSVDTACRIEIDEDVLPGDNAFHLPMRMKDRRQVLLVAPADRDEEESLELSYNGVDLLAYALNPGEALGLGTGTSIHMRRITVRALERVSLPIYSVIILYGVNELSDQSVKDLLVFVQNGGGLFIIPGDEVSPVGFNDTYGALLGGLSIGQLKEPSEVQRLQRSEAQLGHPIFVPMLREEWGDPDDIHFSRYYEVQSTGNALAALLTANGDWLAAVVRRDRGLVVLQFFTASLESSSLPRSTLFVPFVQQIMHVLTREREEAAPEVMRVGEILRVKLPQFRSLGGNVDVSGPEERKFPLSADDESEIRVEGIIKAGAYQVSHPSKKSGGKRWVTVNPVREESDLKTISEENLSRLFGESNVVRIKFDGLASHFASSREWASLLAVFLMVAFAFEALLGAWQSRVGAREEGGPG
ncbi:MAG: VWA domain-containing protein, partial [Planctomycetota bacterium]|nr:VWA domain-containing protein [Planctomycetota bacterium]